MGSTRGVLILVLTTVVAGAKLAANLLAEAPEPPIAQPNTLNEPDCYYPPGVPLWTPIDEQVLALAFSPDGKKLATGGARHTLPGQFKIWDVATGKNLITLKGMRGIRTLAYSPDGKSIATGDFGGNIILRDPDTGEEQKSANAHKVGINSLAFSVDGTLLATAGLDKLVKLWDVNGLQVKKVFTGHTGMIYSAAFFRSGKAIVTGGQDRTARIWDVETGVAKHVLENDAIVEGIAISPDDKLVATANWDATVKLWDADTGQQVGVLPAHDSGVYAVAFAAHDGNLLASATSAGFVYLWDVKAQKSIAKFEKHAGAVWSVAFSPDGKILASGSSDKTAKLWNVADGKEAAAFNTGTPAAKPIAALVYAPDAKTVAIATEDNAIQLRDAQNGEISLIMADHAERITCLAFAPDGRMLASGSADKTIKFWDAATGKVITTLAPRAAGVNALAFTPDGKKLASAGDDKLITLWDAALHKELTTLKGHDDVIRTLAFAADGQSLASAGADRTIKIWDLSKQAEPITLKGHERTVRALAYSPVDKIVASASEDGSLRIWGTADWKERHVLKQHAGGVWSLTFSPSGRMLISGGEDGSVIVWDPVDGKARRTLKTHKLGVTVLAAAPQGEHLLSGSQDMTVLRWRGTPANAPPITLPANPGGAWFATYSPGGDWLASGGQDGNVTLWSRSLAPASYPFRSRYGVYWDAAYSPDGRNMALANNFKVQICAVDTGETRHTLTMKNLLRSVAFSPDGKYVAASTGSWKQPDIPYEAALWDVATGQELAKLDGHTGVVFRVKFSPDGKVLATSSKDKTIRLWEVPSGKLRGILTGHLAPAKGMVFLPGGTLVTASWDKTIRFWDVATLKETKAWKTDIAWACLDVSPDGALLAAAEAAPEGKGKAPLKVWDVASSKEIYNLEGHESRIMGVAFTRDGRGLVTAGGKLDAYGEVAYFDLSTGKLRGTHKTGGQWIENVAASPDGKRVLTAAANNLHLWDVDFVHAERTWSASKSIVSCGLFVSDNVLATGSWDWTIRLWDVAKAEPSASLKGHKGAIRSLALLSDRKTLLSSSIDKTIKIWNIANAEEKTTLEGNTMIPYSLAVSPDGKTLASGGGDHQVKGGPGELMLWDLETGKPRKTFAEIAKTVWSVAISPDGTMLAAMDTGSVKIWDLKTGLLRMTPPAPYARPVAFSPDGKLLAVGDGKGPPQVQQPEGNVHLWNTQTWQKQAVLQDHKHFVFTVAFAPDGRTLASSSQDATVRLWATPRGAGAIEAPIAVAAKVKNLSEVVRGRLQDAVPMAATETGEESPGYTRLWVALGVVLFLGAAAAVGLRRRLLHAARGSRLVTRPVKSHSRRSSTTGHDARTGVRAGPPSGALVTFACGCGKKLRDSAAGAGKKLKCPECGAAVVVPGKSTPSSSDGD